MMSFWYAIPFQICRQQKYGLLLLLMLIMFLKT
jgi:hypothetical protein